MMKREASNANGNGLDTTVNVYRCNKGVRRVEGLKKQQLANGTDVAVVPAAVSVLLSDNHLEFTLVLDTAALPGGEEEDTSQAGRQEWLGFSYFGYLENLKRCFRKPYQDLPSFFKILHENITFSFPSPFTSPFLLIGEEKAFWQISSPKPPHGILGFIPFRPVNTFHSLKSHPILSLEGEHYPVLSMATTVDRNSLLLRSLECDKLYTAMLNKFFCKPSATYSTSALISLPPDMESNLVNRHLSDRLIQAFHQHSSLVNLTNGGSHEETPGNHDVSGSSNSTLNGKEGQPTKRSKPKQAPVFVSNLLLSHGTFVQRCDLVSVSTSSLGKSQLAQIIHRFRPTPALIDHASSHNLFRSPDAAGVQEFKKELKAFLSSVLKIEEIIHSRIAIYNPFLLTCENVSMTSSLLVPPSIDQCHTRPSAWPPHNNSVIDPATHKKPSYLLFSHNASSSSILHFNNATEILDEARRQASRNKKPFSLPRQAVSLPSSLKPEMTTKRAGIEAATTITERLCLQQLLTPSLLSHSLNNGSSLAPHLNNIQPDQQTKSSNRVLSNELRSHQQPTPTHPKQLPKSQNLHLSSPQLIEDPINLPATGNTSAGDPSFLDPSILLTGKAVHTNNNAPRSSPFPLQTSQPPHQLPPFYQMQQDAAISPITVPSNINPHMMAEAVASAIAAMGLKGSHHQPQKHHGQTSNTRSSSPLYPQSEHTGAVPFSRPAVNLSPHFNTPHYPPPTAPPTAAYYPLPLPLPAAAVVTANTALPQLRHQHGDHRQRTAGPYPTAPAVDIK